MLAIGEDVKGLLDFLRPMYALYVGGMGARGKNFYNELACQYGYEKEAKEIQDLYLDGKKKEAEALVPMEWIEASNLVGPASYVQERIAAFGEAGVTHLSIVPVGDDPAGTGVPGQGLGVVTLLGRVGRRGRFDNLAEIRTLDPYDDADRDRIVTLTARHDFPWDFDQGVAIAFLRDYGVPSIARLLDRTRQFEDDGVKRYDDTLIFQEEAVVDGVDSPRAQGRLDRLNRIHGHYEIPNDEFQYVLATTLVGPVRWIEKYGWRRLDPVELVALTRFTTRFGELMNITGLPETYDGYLDAARRLRARALRARPGQHPGHRGHDPDRPADRALVPPARLPPRHDRPDGRAAARGARHAGASRGCWWPPSTSGSGPARRCCASSPRRASRRTSASTRRTPTATSSTRSARPRCSTSSTSTKKEQSVA